MYDGIRGGGSFWYSLFFVVCVGLGQFVVLNLFLSVLLGNIDMIVSDDFLLVTDTVIPTDIGLEPPEGKGSLDISFALGVTLDYISDNVRRGGLKVVYAIEDVLSTSVLLAI